LDFAESSVGGEPLAVDGFPGISKVVNPKGFPAVGNFPRQILDGNPIQNLKSKIEFPNSHELIGKFPTASIIEFDLLFKAHADK
jgi:hypothetical protein